MKSHTYRNHRIVRRFEVDPNWAQNEHLKWSIDLHDADRESAWYSHGYATLAHAKSAIDELLDNAPSMVR